MVLQTISSAQSPCCLFVRNAELASVGTRPLTSNSVSISNGDSDTRRWMVSMYIAFMRRSLHIAYPAKMVEGDGTKLDEGRISEIVAYLRKSVKRSDGH